MSTFYIDRHYESGNASDKIKNRIENIVDDVVDYIDNDFKIYYDYKSIVEEEKDAAYAVTIMILR